MVAVLASQGARAHGWAARAVLSVARGWAGKGARVVLADVNFEAPELHSAAGAPNREGLSDALLFGSSFQRLSRTLGEGLVLFTAGTAVPDAEALRVHPRWRDFAEGFRQAESLLLLYLPAEAPGADALAEIADAVLVLAGPAEAATVATPEGKRVVACRGPEVDADGSPRESVSAGPDEVGAGAPLGEADAPAMAPTLEEILAAADARQASTGGAAHLTGLPAREAPPEEHRSAGRATARDTDTGSKVRLTIAALLLAVLAVLVAGRLGIVRIPGVTPQESEGEEPRVEGSAVPEASAAEPREPAALEVAAAVDAGEDRGPVGDPGLESPYADLVVTLASYADLESARRRVRALTRTAPEVQFLVAPVEVRGQSWFRVLAGNAADADEAQALLDDLASVMPGEDRWIIRRSRLGYLLGSLPDLASTEMAVDELEEKGVPVHILRYTAPTGRTEFRVYAGAYGDADEARFMGEFLLERQINHAVLSERKGVRPE